MIRERIIAFDVDSVLFDINREVILPALELNGYKHGLEEIYDFDYGRCLGPAQKKIAYREFARPDLYDGFRIDDQPQLVLEILRGWGNRVLAVSTPFTGHTDSKWRFLLRSGFDAKDIVLCGDKSLVEFDVLVDDRPDTVEAMPRRAVVFDQPWNRHVEGVPRAYGWWDMLAVLKEVTSR